MELTREMFEQYFRNTVDMLNDIGVDFFVHGSTLLGHERQGQLMLRPDVLHDKELNFGILAQDFTPKVYYELATRNKHLYSIETELPNVFNFFSTFDFENKDHTMRWNMWELPCFSLIALFWIGKTKAIEYVGNDVAICWDKKHLDKTKWETIEMCGRKVKTPYLRDKWLTHYYGDYMQEVKQWHYNSDSLNRVS